MKQEKSMDVNKITLLGRIVNDPVVKKTKTGKDVTSCSLATNLVWKSSKGSNTTKEAEFHNLIFWGSIASIAGKYLKKADRVYIEGRLRTRKWEDKSNVMHYKTEVIVSELVMLGGKKAEQTAKELAVEEIIVEE